MVRKNSFRPQCESLEARDVPAVIVDGTFNNPGTPQVTLVPNGGTVTVQEVELNSVTGTDVVFDTNFNAVQVMKSGTAGDNLTLTLNGSTLTVSNSDGVFVRGTFMGTTFFQQISGNLDIQNVTGLNVNLQLGGNDSITDNTTLGSTINGGAGNDTINVGGRAIDPVLLQLLMQPGGLNPAFLPLLSQMTGAAKNISGGDGDDTITVNGFAAMFVIDGGAGADRINGPTFGLFNQLKGGADNDIIVGGMGQDIIFGDTGLDILFGFGGNDFFISVDGSPDFVLNQPGDTVIADPGLDILSLPV